MKKVLYVFSGEKASGAEIVLERLISYNRSSVEPHLFISPGKFADELISAAGKTYPIITVNRLRKLNRSSTSTFRFLKEALKNYFLVSSQVIKYVRKNEITHIHANTIVPASYLILAIIYSRFLKKRKVWIWSDHDLQYFSKIDILFSKICAILYSKTFVVSKAVKKKYGNKKSVVVLYNGLDLEVYKANDTEKDAFRKENKFLNDQLIISIAATISPRKGQLQLIKVFKLLTSSYTNINLVIAGSFGHDDDYYNTEVKNAIKDNQNIFYFGHVANMIQLYCGSDVIINNSNKSGGEPLGTTIYEAMACEKIVIASDTGGTQEIITNKEDGFVFDAEDDESLKETLEFVIVNINSLNEMKKRARRKAEKKFNINTMINNYNNLM